MSYRAFEVSLAIAAVYMSCLEEQEYHFYKVETEYLNVTDMENPPRSLRALCVTLLVTLVVMSRDSDTMSRLRSASCLLIIALVVACGCYSCGHYTRLLQGIFTYVIFAALALVCPHAVLPPIRFYVGCILYAATIRHCSPASKDPTTLLDGCFQCDATVVVSAAVVGAAAIVSASCKQLDVAAASVPHLCAVLQLVAFTIIWLRPTSFVYSVDASRWSLHGDELQRLDGFQARRNAFVGLYPATQLITVLSALVGELEHADNFKSEWIAVGCLFISGSYIYMRILALGNPSPSHYILIDVCFIGFVCVIAILSCVGRRIPPTVAAASLQIFISIDIVATAFDYDFPVLVSYFTIFSNLLLIMLLAITVSMWQVSPCVARVGMVAGEAISLWLLLAYSTVFSLVDDFSWEIVIPPIYRELVSAHGQESSTLQLAGLHAGAKALMSHMAPATVWVVLHKGRRGPPALPPGHHRTTVVVVWCVSVVAACVVYVATIVTIGSGLPDSYPLSDNVKLTFNAIVVVVIPFLCAA